jgi:prevent-host-death family protein
MSEVGVFDAKNKLSALLDIVERGGEVTITRRGKAVARLVPASAASGATDVVERLRALREGIGKRGRTLSWKVLRAYRDEGRP